VEQFSRWVGLFPRLVSRTAFVFGVSQTKVLEGAEPASLEPPRQALTG
jgi:hypothetical protein